MVDMAKAQCDRIEARWQHKLLKLKAAASSINHDPSLLSLKRLADGLALPSICFLMYGTKRWTLYTRLGQAQF
jgi:hypothetical protein